MRELINLVESNLFEAPEIKKTVIALVKTTDNEALLQRVLKTLRAGNIDERIVAVIGKDPDASRFVTQIANVIVSMDFPVEAKEVFLKRFPAGIVDATTMLNGEPQSFLSLVGDDEFAKELFKLLTTTLTSQGVGPGEVALAAFSPEIQWSGRAAGGGDILVGKRAVEVKTRVAKGGRWINPRKAKMDLAGVKQEIITATGISTWPDRIGIKTWSTEVVPKIDPKNLSTVCSKIAAKIFTHVTTTNYANALAAAEPAALIDEHLRTGYENYKAVSGFEGILLMDLPNESLQYFKDYDSMKGKIGVGTIYIYAPEGEIMPQVVLSPVAGVSITPPKASKAAAGTPAPAPAPAPTPLPGKRIKIAPPTNAKFAGKGKISGPKGVGREQR